jgi:hypothetical protein
VRYLESYEGGVGLPVIRACLERKPKLTKSSLSLSCSDSREKVTRKSVFTKKRQNQNCTKILHHTQNNTKILPLFSRVIQNLAAIKNHIKMLPPTSFSRYSAIQYYYKLYSAKVGIDHHRFLIIF